MMHRFSDVIQTPLPKEHWADDPNLYSEQNREFASLMQTVTPQGMHTPRVLNPNFVRAHNQETDMVDAVQQYEYTNVFPDASVQNSEMVVSNFVDSWQRF